MLFPMWATKGCLQPFRFKEIDYTTRAAGRRLNTMLKIAPATVADDSNLP